MARDNVLMYAGFRKVVSWFEITAVSGSSLCSHWHLMLFVSVVAQGVLESTVLLYGPTDTSTLYTDQMFKSHMYRENPVENVTPVLSFTVQLPNVWRVPGPEASQGMCSRRKRRCYIQKAIPSANEILGAPYFTPVVVVVLGGGI